MGIFVCDVEPVPVLAHDQLQKEPRLFTEPHVSGSKNAVKMCVFPGGAGAARTSAQGQSFCPGVLLPRGAGTTVQSSQKRNMAVARLSQVKQNILLVASAQEQDPNPNLHVSESEKLREIKRVISP